MNRRGSSFDHARRNAARFLADTGDDASTPTEAADAITTEAGDTITTEAGDTLVWE